MADINYLINDPTTPHLVIPVDLPPKPGVLNFKIEGFNGPTQNIGTLEHQAASCHYTIVQAINLINSYLKMPITKWATVPVLTVKPRAGQQFNAYYDRNSLRFFYATDPVAKKVIYTVNSTDVVAHELGHAILDSIRPDLYNIQSMEVWAFHEAFGDIHAIMNMLQHDLVLDAVLTETNNDIRKDNIVAKIAEEMGNAIYNVTKGKMGNSSVALRNAVNEFKYVLPEKLPRKGLDTSLTSEPHNFSRVFVGAWYSILAEIFEYNKSNMSPKEALIEARNTMCLYTYRSLRNAAAGVRFYNAMARSMLLVDKANNYKYNSLMNKVFIERGILKEAVKPLIDINWSWFKDLIDSTWEIEEDSTIISVRKPKIETMPLPNHMVTVEVPLDEYYEFVDGNCINMISGDSEDFVAHANDCVDFLFDQGLIRSDSVTPFEISNDGSLVRTHFACDCIFDNSKIPGEPEYGKGFKPENNGGCGCSSKKQKTCETVLEDRVIRQKLVRERN